MSLRNKLLYDHGGKRIRLSVWKDSRNRLVMHLQEYDVEGDFESFAVFNSWSVTVAREACSRATQAAIQRFYDAHYPLAVDTVREREKVLLGGVPTESKVNA